MLRLNLNLTKISSIVLILILYATSGQAAQCKQVGKGANYYVWYSNTSSEKGKKECSMGRHIFCALSTVQISDVRGWCYVGQNMGDWKLVTVNDRNVRLSQTCGAVCIDKIPNVSTLPSRTAHPNAQARWIKIGGGGRGKDIAIDRSGRPWVIGTDNGIYYYDGTRWVQYPGGGRGLAIAVALDGTPWVIGTDNGIYRGTGSGWVQYPGGGRGKDIAIDGSGRPWVIGTDNGIYYHDGTRWIQYPGDGRGYRLSVAQSGSPYVIGLDKAIWRSGHNGRR